MSSQNSPSNSSGQVKTTVKDSLANQLVAGSMAGLFSDACVHPIDTIRARLQTQSSKQMHYKGTSHVIREILEKEGPRAFYKGFGAVAVGTVPGHGLYFAGYEGTKKLLGAEHEGVWLIAGLVADVAGALAWTPMDIIKQRMQIRKHDARKMKLGSWTAAQELWHAEGLRGFYRGFGAGIATYAPFVMIYFSLYERSKILTADHYYADGRSPLQLPFYTCLVLAAFAGAVSSLVTCPFDVVKTRMQTRTVHNYTHLLDGVKTIAREEGFTAFFKGSGPRMIWIGGGTAITMMAYEHCKQLLRSEEDVIQERL